ncbi:MAG: pilus assembly protein PilM [Myxococcota bacterium]|nr:pilus assembly protein PilM [Myxococcota bacterium]
MTKTVVGLDLGSHSIKAAEVQKGLRSQEPVQIQVMATGDGVESSPGQALREFMELHALPADNVTCAMPGQRVANRRLEFPFREKKKLAQAIPFEIEGTMPFDFEDLVVDWQIVGGEQNHAIVAASAAQKKDVAEFLEKVEGAAGCSLRILEAEGLVLGNLAAIYALPGLRLLADIGHRKTTVCLCVDGKPVAGRTMPVAGEALTEAIARDGNMDSAHAERVKHEIELFVPGRDGADPNALAVVDRIARELVRSLGALGAEAGTASDESDRRIVLMGGTAKLKGIEEYLEERTGVPTELLGTPEDSAWAGALETRDPVLFGPAIALALRSTSLALTQFNFRQGEFGYRSSYAWLAGPELRPTLSLALVCLLLFGASTATSIRIEAGRAEQLEDQMASRYASMFPGRAPPARPISALAQEVDSARERANFLGLYGGNLSALDLLTVLSERIPYDLTVKFDEINIDQNVIRIKVAAQNYEAQDRLENVLKLEPVFAAADVTGSAKRLKDGSVTFGLSIPLKQPEGSDE